MNCFPIGVLLESFRMKTDDALKQVVRLGIDGIQMGANYKEHAPENLSVSDRKELLKKVKDHGLQISALCGDFGCGFGHPEQNPEIIEKTKKIIELAPDLETKIVTTHIGVVPGNPAHERYKIMQEACYTLAREAEKKNVVLAVETGPETAETLKGFLDSIGSKGIGVNMDPANLVMVTGDDPVQAVYILKDHIVHTHAKDGRKLAESDPEVLYGDIEAAIQNVVYFEEVPLGQGSVDFDAYLHALTEIGYIGFLTIEREVGENPAADINLAVEFLRSKIG